MYAYRYILFGFRCKRTGKPANQLPTASIIIEIQNEAVSVILRMVIRWGFFFFIVHCIKLIKVKETL